MYIRARMRYEKQVGLLAVVLMHAALLMAWRRPALHEPIQAQRESQLFLLAPSNMGRQAAPNRQPAVTAKSRATAKATVSPPESALIAVPITPPSVEAATQVAPPVDTVKSELVQPEAQAPTILDKSRKLVAGVDKQLRKESLNEKDRAPPHEPKLATDIAAAYRERTFLTTDIKMPNGDVITKVRRGFGTYCIRTNGNRNVGTRDPFKDSGQQSIVNCPK